VCDGVRVWGVGGLVLVIAEWCLEVGLAESGVMESGVRRDSVVGRVDAIVLGLRRVTCFPGMVDLPLAALRGLVSIHGFLPLRVECALLGEVPLVWTAEVVVWLPLRRSVSAVASVSLVS
jgi:hypothetical protein